MRTFKLRYAFKPTDIILSVAAMIVVAGLGPWAALAAVLVLVARDNLIFTLDERLDAAVKAFKLDPTAEREVEHSA